MYICIYYGYYIHIYKYKKKFSFYVMYKNVKILKYVYLDKA